MTSHFPPGRGNFQGDTNTTWNVPESRRTPCPGGPGHRPVPWAWQLPEAPKSESLCPSRGPPSCGALAPRGQLCHLLPHLGTAETPLPAQQSHRRRPPDGCFAPWLHMFQTHCPPLAGCTCPPERGQQLWQWPGVGRDSGTRCPFLPKCGPGDRTLQGGTGMTSSFPSAEVGVREAEEPTDWPGAKDAVVAPPPPQGSAHPGPLLHPLTQKGDRGQTLTPACHRPRGRP